MAVVNTWGVASMEAYPNADGEIDVVCNVCWTLTGKDGQYEASVYGSQPVALKAGEPFTPYNDLTLEQVIGWVKDAMGADQVAMYEENVENQIANLMDPPVITPPLPWAQPLGPTPV